LGGKGGGREGGEIGKWEGCGEVRVGVDEGWVGKGNVSGFSGGRQWGVEGDGGCWKVGGRMGGGGGAWGRGRNGKRDRR